MRMKLLEISKTGDNKNMSSINENADLSSFTINELLDGLYVLRYSSLDSPTWKASRKSARDKIVAELETRSVKDLVNHLVIIATE